MIKEYSRKPHQLKAIQWDGTNTEEVFKLACEMLDADKAWNHVTGDFSYEVSPLFNNEVRFHIPKGQTLMTWFEVGDYLIVQKGKFERLDKDYFDSQYE